MGAETIILVIALVVVAIGSVAGAYIYGAHCARETNKAWAYAIKDHNDMQHKLDKERTAWMKTHKDLVDYNTRLAEYTRDSMQREMQFVAAMPTKMLDDIRTIIYTAIATQKPDYIPPIKDSDEQETQVVPRMTDPKKKGGTLAAKS